MYGKTNNFLYFTFSIQCLQINVYKNIETRAKMRFRFYTNHGEHLNYEVYYEN